MKKIKLNDSQLQSLQQLNSKKFQGYQQITAITLETNEQDSQWWNEIYKTHKLDSKGKYEIEATKDGVFLKEVK